MRIFPGRRLPKLSFLLVGSAGRRCRGRILNFPLKFGCPSAQVPIIPPVGGPLSPCASDALCRGQDANSTSGWSAEPLGLRSLGRTVPSCRQNGDALSRRTLLKTFDEDTSMNRSGYITSHARQALKYILVPVAHIKEFDCITSCLADRPIRFFLQCQQHFDVFDAMDLRFQRNLLYYIPSA